MKSILAALLMLALPAAQALAACHIRYGYSDAETAPYFLGTGPHEAQPPGAGVEMTREIATLAGCTISAVRLPRPRLPLSLQNGEIDLLGTGPDLAGSNQIVYPRAADGAPDGKRALHLYMVVFVRAADQAALQRDTMAALRGKRLGLVRGLPYGSMFSSAGITVDDGAPDAPRSLEKLRLGRIDAFAASLPFPADLDALVRQRYGNSIVRLDQPLFETRLWLVTSKSFYDQYPQQVEAIWRLLGESGSSRLARALQKYN